MVKQYDSFISRPEISFWVPIIVAFATAAFSWANLTSKVDLLSQKVDGLIEQNKILIEKYASVESRYGTLAIKVNTLEVKVK